MTSPGDLTPLAQYAQIKQRYVAAVKEEASFDAGCLMKAIMFMFIALSALTLVRLPYAVHLIRNWRNRRAHSAAMREAVRFSEQAEPVIVAPFTLNPVLRQPSALPAPALVLLTFDRSVSTDELIGWIGLIEGSLQAPPSQTQAAARFDTSLLQDIRFVPFRRRRVPTAVTAGRIAYICDLLIVPQLLVGGCVSSARPLVACMAEPGDEGRIVQCPPWITGVSDAPTAIERRAFLESLLMIDALPKEPMHRDAPVSASRPDT